MCLHLRGKAARVDRVVTPQPAVLDHDPVIDAAGGCSERFRGLSRDLGAERSTPRHRPPRATGRSRLSPGEARLRRRLTPRGARGYRAVPSSGGTTTQITWPVLTGWPGCTDSSV